MRSRKRWILCGGCCGKNGYENSLSRKNIMLGLLFIVVCGYLPRRRTGVYPIYHARSNADDPFIINDFKGFFNLMIGRCVPSDRAINLSFRVKANCMAMGRAAGTAAARDKVDVQDMSIDKRKETFNQNGAIISGKEKSSEELNYHPERKFR